MLLKQFNGLNLLDGLNPYSISLAVKKILGNIKLKAKIICSTFEIGK